MKNKLKINEGEIQRILGLHKKAVLKENKFLNEVGLGGENEPDFSKRGDSIYNAKTIKVKPKSDKKGFAYTYAKGAKLPGTTPNSPATQFKGGNMYFRCSPYKGDAHFKHNKLFWVNTKLSNELKKAFCQSKNNKDSYTQLYNQKIENKGSGRGITFPKGTVWRWKSESNEEQINLTEKCKIRKPKGGSVKTQDVSYYYNGVSKCEYGQGSKGFKSEKECNKTCVKQIDNEDGDEGSDELTKVRGNRYTFDFDTIMKAINDTGKCGGFSGSSDGLSGTSGTQGTAGTSGDGGIQNPLPITNRLSKDLYFKMISD